MTLDRCMLLVSCLSACQAGAAVHQRVPATGPEPPQAQLPAESNVTAPQAGHLDAASRRLLLDGIARKLEAHYVYLELAVRMRQALEAHAARGAYDSVTDGPAFAELVSRHLRDVSHDAHLGVTFGRPAWATPPPTLEERVERMRRRNFWFGEIERMPGDVARVVIDGFVPMVHEDVREAIGHMMSSVADARALILDLRNNQGGEPETVLFVASYLFDERPVHLSDIYRRDNDSTQEFWTLRELPGKRFGGTKPVYIVTSKATFSGGEDLAYSLQAIRRATVVGEQTGGGAHPCDAYSIDDVFYVVVPWGRGINPVTKTNWEGVGVIPDVAVPADQALEEAHRRALQELSARRTKT